eukprot:Selendium_serpulae@DN6281_c0_g1_i1.p1
MTNLTSSSFSDVLAMDFERLQPLLVPQTPLIVPCNIPVFDCVTKISASHLRSCVVSDAPVTDLRPDNIKLMDMRDVVGEFVAFYEKEKGTDAEIIQKFQKLPVGPMANESKKNNFEGLPTTATLAEIAKAFEASARVPIFKDGKLVRVFGVYDFVCILTKTKCLEKLNDASRLHGVLTQEFGATFGKALLQRGVERVDEATPLIEVMKRMHTTGYSALPIQENDEGKDSLLGLISVRDMRLLVLWPQKDMAEDVLSKPVIEYLSYLRMHTPKSTFPYIHTSSCSSLITIMTKIMGTSIHRILLTDGHNGDLVGLVSVTDVAKLLAREAAIQEKTHGK